MDKNCPHCTPLTACSFKHFKPEAETNLLSPARIREEQAFSEEAAKEIPRLGNMRNDPEAMRYVIVTLPPEYDSCEKAEAAVEQVLLALAWETEGVAAYADGYGNTVTHGPKVWA